jgi:flavoprotein hydroxylase
MSGCDCDVLVVGAGPVGQITALLLAKHGLRVIVLERWQRPYALPRAVALAHDVLRVLHTLGLGARLDGLLEPWGQPGQEFVLEGADGQLLSEARYALDSPSGHPQMCGFSQPDLEALLEQRVSAVAAIDQRRGVTVHSLRTVGDHVDVRAVNSGGHDLTLSARYVVGCDGANSTVRELIGAPVTDLRFDRDWLVVDVVPHGPLPNRMRHAGQRLDPARPTTFVPAGPKRRRFEFMIMPGDDAAQLDTDAGAWHLLPRGDSNRPTANWFATPATRFGRAGPLSGEPARSCWPVTPPTRCRRSSARGSTPASATPRTSPGGSRG